MTFPDAITDALPPDDRLRIGKVKQVAPLLVDVQGGDVITPGVLNYANFTVGDTVSLLRQDQSWLVLGTNASSNDAVLTGQVSVSMNPGADTTAVGTFGNFGVGTSTTFTKRLSTTKLRIDFSASCFATGASAGARFGMDVFNSANAYQFTMCQMFINNIGEHLMFAGGGLFTGVAAGTYTLQPLWLRYSGAGTLNSVATDDWLTYIVSEVN